MTGRVARITTADSAQSIGNSRRGDEWADVLDPQTRSVWCVIVTGIATLVTDPKEQRCCRELLNPWFGGGTEHVVRTSADVVTGYRIG
ncbi:hypothetical protein [Streptomyces sp. CBMA123]|uniref:hypothetical protein n=1 Tax=Streptomyces sp. CBMA123 TaxID=1896313 RepID=UPI0016618E07|nr:hypothetical protein [Streptomyces sp. CBMA123]